MPPLIPLGRSGTLQLGARAVPLPWQVVGYVERCEVDVEAGEEQSTWREHVLYHREDGFAFLVDAEDGWSFARPITGVPQIRDDQVSWQGTNYTKLYSYSGAVTYVLGEFYWRLAKGEKTRNTDFAAGKKRLNREQAGHEVTWSAGEALDADAVAKAFGLGEAQALPMRRDVGPLSAQATSLGSRIVVYAVVALVVLALVLMSSRCSSDECDSARAAFGESSNEYQQCLRSRSSTGSSSRGGSFGGFSSGGGHK